MTWVVLLFWICFLALLHSYVIYPLVLQLFGGSVRTWHKKYDLRDNLPHVAILMSAYNEENVIEEKIHSVFKTSYPSNKLSFYIGSDCSSDRTEVIVKKLMNTYESIRFYPYNERRGKANVLNSLIQELTAEVEILILTDANVIFSKDALFEMVAPFKDDRIGQVSANIQNTQVTNEDIGAEEERYISRENKIKYFEGKLWGTMMGAFGACYAMRRKLMPTIPGNFLMEDFFISMHILKKGYKAIMVPESIVYEDIPGSIHQEYRRKRRISAGNFQNLSQYYDLIYRKFFPLGFVFLSHKVLRWIGPFLLIMGGVALLLLALQSNFYAFIFKIAIFLFISALLDLPLQRMGIYLSPLRLLRYFFTMNLALLSGFWMYLKGVKTNAWQPTIRKT